MIFVYQGVLSRHTNVSIDFFIILKILQLFYLKNQCLCYWVHMGHSVYKPEFVPCIIVLIVYTYMDVWISICWYLQ